MAITDEVRQLARRRSFTAEELLDIADRIDKEHKKAMDNSYRDGYQEGKRDGDDEWYEEHESYLEEHGWYQALDADGQVIHADDELFWKDDGTPVGRVTAIGVGQRAGLVWTLTEGDTVSIGHNANLLRHKQLTVENTLRELIGKALTVIEIGGEDKLVVEYAKRLTLRGDAE